MSTINHRKKGSKEFLSIAFCVFVVVVFSIIIIIIIIDNFLLFFKNWKKKDMVKNQLPIIFSLSNFRTTIFFNNGKMLCKLSQFPIYTVWNTLLQKLHELV